MRELSTGKSDKVSYIQREEGRERREERYSKGEGEGGGERERESVMRASWL